MNKKKTTKKATSKKVAKKATSKSNGTSKANGKKKKTRVKKAGDPAAMRMTGSFYHQFRAAFSEMMETKTRFNLIALEARQERAKEIYRPLVIMLNNEEEAHRAAMKKQKEFAAFQLLVAQKFNIPEAEIYNWSFDIESGMLYPPGEAPKEQGKHSLI